MTKQDLLSRFLQRIKLLCEPQNLDKSTFHIALSGGVDSIVLLHLFSRLRVQYANMVINAHHVNHGLSPHAKDWSAFCQSVCRDLDINFNVSSVDLLKKNRISLEALAREKRYACLTAELHNNDYLVTAHHQDDQLETVLLALKRGAGNTGLQGILSKQSINTGYLIRPLLDFPRIQLEAYAQLFNLKWIEDESNEDQRFDRNFIRHSISPLLKARWPAITKTVSRSASLCQEQQALLVEIAVQDFSQCAELKLNQQRIDIDKLKAFSAARRNNVLRYWFKQNNLNYPSAKQLNAIWFETALASDNASPDIPFKGVTLRRYRKHLYFVKDIIDIDCEPIYWHGEKTVNLLDGRLTLKFECSNNEIDLLSFAQDKEVKICFRQHLPSKLKCRPIGRTGSRSVKKLLHEYNVPPWLRETVPFLLIDEQVVEAVGLWRCMTSPIERTDYLTVSFA